MYSRSAISWVRESAGREAQHIHFATGEPARILRPGGGGRFRHSVTGSHEHGVGRARFQHAL